jgi:hypothetical protein
MLRSVLRSVLPLAVMFACAIPLAAAEGDAPVKEKKKKGSKAGAAVFRLPAEITLTAEQQTKLDAVKKEFGPRAKEVAEKQEAVMTAEQRKARRAATTAAREAGKKRKEARAEIDAATNLSDEQKAKQKEVAKEMKALEAEVREKIEAFLTDEQKAAWPKKKVRKEKKPETT